MLEGCKSHRGQLHPPGGLGQGRAIGEHLQLLCWSRIMRKILDFFNAFLSSCSDCARSFTALLPREAGLVILTVSMQKISLLKKQTVLTCTACHSEDLSTKKLFKIWRVFFLSLNNVSSLSFLYFEFQRGLTFHISEECLTFQTLFHLCFVIFLSNPHVRLF